MMVLLLSTALFLIPGFRDQHGKVSRGLPIKINM
jgi:hypothetical protein